jgi:hypothetical protein
LNLTPEEFKKSVDAVDFYNVNYFVLHNYELKEQTIIEELLCLIKTRITGYVDLLKLSHIVPFIIQVSIKTAAKKLQLHPTQLTARVLHNGKEGKEANVILWLINGTEYIEKLPLETFLFNEENMKELAQLGDLFSSKKAA